MEKLVEKGLVRSIGLSNFNSRQIDDILSVASIKPTVLQVWSKFVLDGVRVRSVLWCLVGFCRWRDTPTWLRWSCWPTAGIEAWWWRPTVLWGLLTGLGNIPTSLSFSKSLSSSAWQRNTKSLRLRLSWGEFLCYFFWSMFWTSVISLGILFLK